MAATYDYAHLARLIETYVRDATEGKLSATQIEDAARSGLKQYSRDQPRKLVAETTSAASGYAHDLPSAGNGWVAGDSSVSRIEYPIDQYPRSWVDERAWQFDAERQKIMSASLGTAADLRIYFEAPHTLKDLDSATATTVPAGHFEALGFVCAHDALLALALIEEKRKAQTYQAEAQNHNRGPTVRDQAKAYLQRYRELLGGIGTGGASKGAEAVSAGEVAHGDVVWTPRRRRGIEFHPTHSATR